MSDPGYKTFSPDDLASRLTSGEEVFLLDVREPRQFHAGHIPDAISLPADDFADRYEREINPDDPVVIVCERGQTSVAAAKFLVSLGFTDVATMDGGMKAWIGPLVLPREAK